MDGVVDYGYDIPKEYGGGTRENVQRLEAFIDDLSREQPHMTEKELVKTAKETLFPEEWQKKQEAE